MTGESGRERFRRQEEEMMRRTGELVGAQIDELLVELRGIRAPLERIADSMEEVVDALRDE